MVASLKLLSYSCAYLQIEISVVVCSGLNSFAELLEFTEEALSISKQLFLPPNSDISRIGALYLVYGVYTQQPTRYFNLFSGYYFFKVFLSSEITFCFKGLGKGTDDSRGMVANYRFHCQC